MAGFQVGDTVQVKSGGPVMTVAKIEDGKAHCHWFGSQGKQEFGVFPVVVLEKFEPTRFG